MSGRYWIQTVALSISGGNSLDTYLGDGTYVPDCGNGDIRGGKYGWYLVFKRVTTFDSYNGNLELGRRLNSPNH